MPEVPELPAGVYRHYKGHYYQVLGPGHDANADTLAEWSATAMCCRDSQEPGAYVALGERNVVVYIGLELDDAQRGPRLAVRTVEDFFAPVCAVEACDRYGEAFESDPFMGCIRCKSAPVPRFTYVGPSWEGRDV